MSKKVKFLNKCKDIENALLAQPVDVATLRKLAISPGGLVTQEYRCKVWPYLLNVSDCASERPKNVREHSDYRQVCLDVERSGNRFPKDMSHDVKEKLQQQLIDLILSVLSKHSELFYYQGYHDICITFLFVCGEELSFPLVEKLSTYHLRDFMVRTMDNTTNILNYLFPLLERCKPEFVQYMKKSEVGTVFAISWLITWFSYVIEKQEDIERLYDFFLACHPLMPIYFSVQVILENANEIMAGECEMARVYQLLLNTARKKDLPLELLISNASDFYIQHPPSSLVGYPDYYKNHLAMSTFCDYALVAEHEKPDTVLEKQGLNAKHEAPEKSLSEQKSSSGYWSNLKLAAAAVGGAVGAAVVTVIGQASEWGPQIISYL